MVELFLGQIPEALYFALFMILVKGFKERKVLFAILVVMQYLLLCNIFAYDIKFQFFFIFTSYGIMKLLYKDRVQITDVFLFIYAMLVVIISSGISYIITAFVVRNLFIGNIISKILIYSYILLRKESIIKLYKKYYGNWNRKPDLKIRSLTIRNASLIFMYAIIIILDMHYIFLLLVRR